MKPGQIQFPLQQFKARMIGGYNYINWDVMSRERKHLNVNNTEITSIIKYLNSWLNTGQYYGLVGSQPECPGHGHKGESC